jgi:hypothetical protein
VYQCNKINRPAVTVFKTGGKITLHATRKKPIPIPIITVADKNMNILMVTHYRIDNDNDDHDDQDIKFILHPNLI